jgi:HEAT repeat protein
MRRALLICLVSPILLAACASRAKHSIALYEAGDYAGAARAAEAGLAEHPGDDELWQMRIRAALALGDAEGVARSYATYHERRGEHDAELLSDLAIATLGQALASPSARLKITAIEAVAANEIHALAVQVAERMGDMDDRVAAAAAVAVLRGFPQAPQVAADMLDSEDAEARRIAVDGIGRKVGTLAVSDLREAARDPAARVRRAAIRWLGSLRDTESRPILERNLRHPDESVRAAAAGALAELGSGDLAGYARRALADKALAVRLAGIELLVAAKQTAQLAALAEDRDPMVAVEAAIAAKRTDLAAPALQRAAAAEAWTTRAGAANVAMRAVGKADALALARRLVADLEVGVRLAAARLFASAGDRAAAIGVLANLLTGDSALGAATDLARFDDPRGLSALDAAVRDREAAPAHRAAAAAAHATAHRITPGLVAALADPNAVVRVEAAAALATLAR